MPSPSTSLSTLRPDLAGSFMEFDLEMDRQGFIGHKVAPVVEVGLQSDNPGKIPLEQLLQQRDTSRTSGSGYKRGQFTFTSFTYACEEHGWEEVVDDRDAKRYMSYFNAEQIATMRAKDFVLRNAEDRVADLIFNATTWTGSSLNTSVTNEWDDAANATPIADVEAAAQKVYDNSGMWPNALVINRKVFRNLRLVASIIDQFKAQGFVDVRASKITAAMLATIFDLDYVIVAGSSTNTADVGQTASMSPIWSGEYAMVCRVAETMDHREPCIARTFHWSEDGSEILGTVESYRDETVRGDVVRVRHDVDEVVMYPEMGHLLDNITT